MKKETCRLTRWQILKQQLNNLPPGEFLNGLKNEDDAAILDVRTSAEFKHDRSLPGAKHLDYLNYSFLDQLDSLDKDRTYFVYCRSGRRSVRACMLMKNSGFKKVYNLDGGLLALKKQFNKPD